VKIQKKNSTASKVVSVQDTPSNMPNTRKSCNKPSYIGIIFVEMWGAIMPIKTENLFNDWKYFTCKNLAYLIQI